MHVVWIIGAQGGQTALRWLIQDQIAGLPELSHAPCPWQGRSPLLIWSPYLWADGLVYKRGELSDRDGNHPSPSGRNKVARLLMNSLKSDPKRKTWFLAH